MDAVVKTRIKVGLGLFFTLCGLLYADHLMGRAVCFATIVTFVIVFGLREYAIIARSAGAELESWPLMLFGALLGGVPVLRYELGWEWAPQLTGLLVSLFFFSVTFPALRKSPSKALFHGLCASVFGLVYIWFLASFIQELRYMFGDAKTGLTAAAYTIAIAKGTDVTAFFVGKYFGKTKMIPHISPGKTMAGLWGGLGGALAITCGFCALTPLGTLIPWLVAVPFAIVMGLVVVAGDLIESLMKRSAEVKDSANLLPTFGGILDVVDSILVAAPVVYYLIRGCQALDGRYL